MTTARSINRRRALRPSRSTAEPGGATPVGSVAGAGSIELGLRRGLMEQLEARLAGLPLRRRGSVHWYPAEVSVLASCHWLPDQAVRDAVLHEVTDD